MAKRGSHTIRHRPQFLRTCCKNVKYDEKSSLILSKNRLLRRTHFAKKFFTKRSQIWRITLYTLFAVRADFVHSFLFRHCSRIVCSRLCRSFLCSYQHTTFLTRKHQNLNRAFKFSLISSYFSYYMHNNLFLFVSHYPDFLITSCMYTSEIYVQSNGLRSNSNIMTWVWVSE